MLPCIDLPILSFAALSIVSLLQRFSTMSSVVELLKRTQFEEKILRANETYTLFLPSNRAIRNMPPSEQSKLKSNASAIDFLMDHITYGKYSSRKLGNNFALTSLNRNPVRINKLLRTKVRNRFSNCIYCVILWVSRQHDLKTDFAAKTSLSLSYL